MTYPIINQSFIDPVIADKFLSQSEYLDWEKRGDTPRQEYYCNEHPVPYTYGKGKAKRTYYPKPTPGFVKIIQELLEIRFDCVFDVCFLNRYEDSRNHLGWHSDDSPEMDPQRPIVSISLGQTRPIQWRLKESPEAYWSHELSSGSMFAMMPGFQSKFEHRIPKVGFNATPRVSLTYRGYLPQ